MRLGIVVSQNFGKRFRPTRLVPAGSVHVRLEVFLGHRAIVVYQPKSYSHSRVRAAYHVTWTT
jgi:hypothetical protein